MAVHVAPMLEEALKPFEGHFAPLVLIDVEDKGQDKRPRDFGENSTAVDLDWEEQQYVGKKLFFTPGIDVENMKSTLTRFCKEIKLLSGLKHHENVIKFVGIFYQTNGPPNDSFLLPVLVMEKMLFSLTEYIEAFQHIPEAETITVLYDIAKGLKYLHDQMVVHGNLSSNNILFTPNFVPKITNFGSAQVLKVQKLRHSTLCSSLPEALTNPPCHSFLKDVFSFGCVIIHLTTHQWPIQAGTCKCPENTDLQKFVSMISDSVLLSIVERCLAVEERRLTSKHLLQSLLLETQSPRR